MTTQNSNIILSGIMANPLEAMARGMEIGEAQNVLRRRDALEQAYQQHGEGALAGNPESLNALARLGDFKNPTSIQAHRQDMAFNREEMEFKRAKNRREAADWAREVSAEAAAAEQEKLSRILMGAAAFHAKGDKEGYDNHLRTYRLDPAKYPFENFVSHAASMTGTIEGIKEVRELMAGPKAQSAQGKFYTDQAAGLVPSDAEFKGPGTNLTVNTAPTDERGLPIVDKPAKGYQRKYDEEKRTWVDEPIPGGEVARDRASEGKKLSLAVADYNRKYSVVDGSLDKAIASLEKNGRWVSGWGSYLSGIPESEARDFQAILDTVKANLGFEELQAMRDASPTGGALGQVSEREIAFLQAIQGNLDAAQSPEQLMDILKEIKKRRAEFRAERERIMARDQGAIDAGTLEQTIRGMPDFGSMSDAQLDQWILENGQ